MFAIAWRTSPEQAARVARSVTGHPKRLARLRTCYRGRHDVLDALWWRLNPGERSPAGVADPADDRDRLQREVYSWRADAPGSTADPAPAHLELLRLEQTLRRDARSLDKAIARFEARTLERRPAEPTEPVMVDSLMARRRLPVSTLVAAVALVVSISISAALWWRIQQVTAADDATVASGDPVEAWRTPDVITINALLVFRRTQTMDDVYPLDLAVDYDRRSVRQLTRSDPGDSYRLFATLAASDQVCLVIVFADLSSASTCSSEADFRDDGLTVASHARRVTNGARSEYVTNEVSWLPDGSLVSRDRVSVDDS